MYIAMQAVATKRRRGNRYARRVSRNDLRREQVSESRDRDVDERVSSPVEIVLDSSPAEGFEEVLLLLMALLVRYVGDC